MAPRSGAAPPHEVPLPPMEKPVIVKDDRHTYAPTSDRAVLALCIEELAQKLIRYLEEDVALKHRFARRLRLDNRIRYTEGKREEFKVELPIIASCWNDVNVYEIEYRILQAISKEPKDHIWYHIRLLFDDFIDPETKNYIDKLDRGESLSPDDSQSPQPGTSSQSNQSRHDARAVASSNLNESISSKSTSSARVSSVTKPAKKIKPVVDIELSDEEDITILN